VHVSLVVLISPGKETDGARLSWRKYRDKDNCFSHFSLSLFLFLPPPPSLSLSLRLSRFLLFICCHPIRVFDLRRDWNKYEFYLTKSWRHRDTQGDSNIEREKRERDCKDSRAFLHPTYVEGASNRPENPIFLRIKPVRADKKEERKLKRDGSLPKTWTAQYVLA